MGSKSGISSWEGYIGVALDHSLEPLAFYCCCWR